MNKIIWDLIDTRKVTSFIDNIIVGTEKEKGYNKVVEQCQIQFTLEGESSWSWLRHAQSVKTLCNELSDVDLLE